MTNQPYVGHSRSSEQIFGLRTANVEAEFLLPYLKPGMSLVDCGCGQGTITAGLAEALAPGEVVGFDTLEEHLEKGRKLAQERGLTNLRFEKGDINAPTLPPESFDAAYIHVVLLYLTDPLEALRQICRLLKQGGVIGVVDTGCPSMMSAPNGHHLVTINGLYAQLVQRTHPNPYVESTTYLGLSLKTMLQEAGFSRVEMHPLVTSQSPAKLIQPMKDFSQGSQYKQIIEQGLATKEELDEHLEGAIAWAEDPDAWGFRLWPCAVGFND